MLTHFKPAIAAAGVTASLAFGLTISPTLAVEGMWTPEQLSEIADDMRELGFEMDAEALADLTAFPMGAVISLGGCTASFVSPQGLAVTNHHCAAGSIQFNSTEDDNLLVDGFLAGALADELPAAPGSRIYVTVEFTDVTRDVLGEIDPALEGRARYDAIEAKTKALIAECEADEGHRCDVAAFHGGLEYKRTKQLEIRDVRLVYAPAESIGTYGGDIDNWIWPRHTGDFAFYRAYVAPDGAPADYAEDNVPYAPDHHLSVSSAGLGEGDFVMAAGYPGSTSRYRRTGEVVHAFDWSYPSWVTRLTKWIATIEGASEPGSDVRVKYEDRLGSLNNTLKNFGGQIDGARRVGLVDRRVERETALNEWIAASPDRAQFAEAIAALDAVVDDANAASRANLAYRNANRPQLLAAAKRLYRLAKEKDKPDTEREPGFQERDERFIEQAMERIERRYDPIVDKAEWLLFLEEYMAQPAQARVSVFDEALGLGETFNADEVSATLDRFYAETKLSDLVARKGWMSKPAAAFEASPDRFIALAVALYEHDLAVEDDQKERAGKLQALRPAYMEAIIAWQASEGQVAYPDANSTLRVTYGTVKGGSPRDGLLYAPFTTLEGILEKDTGIEPFNAPADLLAAVKVGDYGPYLHDDIRSVPVNFLSDLDSTGGNSGSPTLNAKGELVGLLFDGTIESVNADWDFDPRTTRTIHVDSRYMLWVMEKIDGASRLIDEMTIVRY